jgi:hypothetical protein
VGDVQSPERFTAKVYPAFVLLFWHGSNLLLVEQLHLASHVLPQGEKQEVLEKAQVYQTTAVTSLHAVAKQIVDVSSFGEFRLINSINATMHLISHHANTALVSTFLSRGIEHTIDLHVSANSQNSSLTGHQSPNGTSDWIATMKPLLTCMLTLKSTVSGTVTAGSQLQRLMQQYGDILMDCYCEEMMPVT